MANKGKIIIIGLDGVSFELVKNLSEEGAMPNTRELISRGLFKKMQSSIPEISSVAWSSLITGKNPGEHGIFGFTDLHPSSYQLRFPNFTDLKAPPFWDSIEGESVVINVPSTYPVKEMRGVLISGFVSVDLEKSVYPDSLIPKLKELDYRLDVDSEKAHKSMDLFLLDLDQTLQALIKVYRYLWENFTWQIFLLVFTSTDRLMHFLWNAYEDRGHRYHTDFLDHFYKIDEIIGEISKKINKEDLLVLLSDHGFERLNKDVYINFFLRKENFLKLKGLKEPSLSEIDASTKAFALDPARIYVNWKDKFPLGSIDRQDKEKILKDLGSLFRSLELDGKKVIKDIFRKEEIYSGPFLDEAPDLVLVGSQGFNLRANMGKDRLADKPIFTGKHRQDNAFLLLNRDFDRGIVPENPTVYEVAGIISNHQRY